eukprot:c18114_g1_i1 orf=273-896(+)
MAQDREQDHTGCKMLDAPLLCTNNCGFLGCPTTMNLCSKCYKDLLSNNKESQLAVKALGEKKPIMLSVCVDKTSLQGPVAAPELKKDDLPGDLVSVSSNPGVQLSAEVMSSKAVSFSASSADTFKSVELIEAILPVAPKAQSSGSTRCFSCHKRVGLLGFRCRCGGVFCSGHRYSDRHSCTFDYKAAGRDAIAKANPVVKAKKVDRI